MSTKPVLQRLRMHYRKDEVLKYIGHLDLMRFIFRCFRRSAFPYATAGYYSPKPCVTFCPTLPLGVMADAEIVDVEVRAGAELGTVDYSHWLGELTNAAAPRELFYRFTELDPASPPISRQAVAARYRLSYSSQASIDAAGGSELQARLDALLSVPLFVEDRGKERDLCAALQNCKVLGSNIELQGHCSGSLHLNVPLLSKQLEARLGLRITESRRVCLLDALGTEL